MTPERWSEVEGLVDRALQLPGHERARFLVSQCAGDEPKLEQVLDLLFAGDEAAAIVTPAWAPVAADDRSTPVPGIDASTLGSAPLSASSGDEGGRSIGSFRVLRQLGRGGMGTVYLAEQRSPVERQVAIKVAHSPLGSEGRLRLAAERQAMARLSHPNIAQVLEAGSTDDHYPYFAMELVDGTPITTYCDDRQLGVEERFSLFLTVCSGVQHAHQKGILHRDLKPANILVTEIDGTPTPKIIDFGIAKALDRPLVDRPLDTGERMIGTPAYLSPEAISSPGGAVLADTRGDVYSLGVILQELLIGERPFPQAAGDTPIAQWRRKTEEDPASPSRCWQDLDDDRRQVMARRRGLERRELERRIRGELDWIVLRAIARDPVDRYPGVSELAADVERFLADEPVLAGPPTATYQLRKLVRRHRLAVVFSLLLLLTLATGLVARSLEAARANRQASEARAARVETEKVVDFLVELFDSANPDQALGQELTAREILAAGTARLEGPELAQAPRVKARLYHTTAQVHWRLGEAGVALGLAEKALTVRRRELGPSHAEVATSLLLVGTLESEVGNYERSEDLLKEALSLRRAIHGESSLEVFTVLKVLGAIHEETNRYDEALAFYDEALGVLEEVDGSVSIETADTLNNMGVVYWRRNEYPAAESLYRRALDLKRETLDPQHPSVAMTWNNLGDLLRDMERLEESHAAYQHAFEIRQKVLGAEHPQLGVTLNSMGNLESRLGHWDAAEDLFQRARVLWQQALGSEHVWVAYAVHNLGRIYYAQGRDEEAETLHRRGLSIRQAALDDSNPALGQSLMFLGQALRPQGRLMEAAAALESSQALLETPSGSKWFLSICLAERGFLALEQGRLSQAEAFFETVRSQAAVDDPPGHRIGLALYGLAKLERARGQEVRAHELARRAVACLENDLPEGHRELSEARQFLAEG